MSYATAIGLDVHARSITAVALSRDTGEVLAKTFDYDPASVAGWILGFEEPKAVYESGVTGFHLVRALREMGVDCAVGAVSKMHKPAADKRRKNDRNDAEFLARQLMAHNVVEAFVPDERTEGARNLSRALEDLRDDLARAKHRLTHQLIKWGCVWDEKAPDGKRKGTWTRAHWEWIRSIELPDACAREALDLYISQVRHIEAQKKAIEKRIAQHAQEERWQSRVEALRCMKGIEVATAFALVVEVGVFNRFDSARSFSSWLGLVPSERSSGERTLRGGITKAGNSHLRKLLVEASWHYTRATGERKRGMYGCEVPIHIANHAADGIARLVKRREGFVARRMRPVVANVATARELSCWVWALGRMCEGTL
ncbi:IS110 family transposase [Gordonibacter sp. 28C]|uniref:IS110 family transposase n=1 Tax=Gordonibacter sp. 28C TaxID=2078569 RepID=UPI000DF77278|nr:IS110 family transposase [Gordonibacter sp. 28C]RDB58237.1 IS110 family transposase [Gordonibacter sp. 28C]